jgi:hypothetical protein
MLESTDFDEQTRELIGLDDIEEILGQIDEEAEIDTEAMEKEAEAIKAGEDPTNIKSADEVIEEMDEEMPEAEVPEADGEGTVSEPAGGDGSGATDASETDPETEKEPEPE